MNGLVLTREMLMQSAGFQPVKDLSRSLRATRKALHADKHGYVDGAGVEHPASPDHPTRLKAADQFYRLYDVYPDRQREPTDPSRPVAVTIVLAGNGNGHGPDARAALSSHGVRLHLDDGGGPGA